MLRFTINTLEENDHAAFTKPIWSGPDLYCTTVWTKFGFVNGTQVQTKAGPAYAQRPWFNKIWYGTKSGYVNVHRPSDQIKCLTLKHASIIIMLINKLLQSVSCSTEGFIDRSYDPFPWSNLKD